MPAGLALDRAGNIFIADREDHRVRKIEVRTGIISTVIGDGTRGFSGDGGPATQASLYRPHNGVFDRQGNLVFGDSFNQRIRRWDHHTGLITTLAGTGEAGSSPDGTPAAEARFRYFGALAFDRGNNLIVTGINQFIQRIDAKTGRLSTIAGTGEAGFSGRWRTGQRRASQRPLRHGAHARRRHHLRRFL